MYSGNNIFGSSNQRKKIKNRTWTVMVIFILFFCFLIWRIMNYMYFKSEPLKTMFNAQYTIDEPYGSQYRLTDCNGSELLEYEVKYFAVIDPVDYLRFNEYTRKYDMQVLAITLRNYNSDYDLKNIKGSGSFEKVKYKIDKETYDKLKDIKGVKGFYTYISNDVVKDNYWKIENILTDPRYYKDDKPEYKSADSLEMQIYNKTKNNKFTKIRFAKGVNGEIAKGEIIKPKNNVNVKLTLDKAIEEKIEVILHDEKLKKYSQIGVVLMESSTGKIRAMTQKNDNTYNANLGMPGTNGAVAGSIFKVIVDEALLDKNLAYNDKMYTVDYKIFPGGHETFGKYTLAEALSYSSNNVFAQLGSEVGSETMYNYAEKQGMLGKVLNLHHEQSGKFEVDLFNPKVEVGDKSLTAIGQKIRITPLEAIAIPNTIINNGIYVQPSIIDAYVNDKNEILEKIPVKTKTVLKTETAEVVKNHMMNVVEVGKGIGTQAYIKDMGIGGKTGTSTYYVKDKNGKDKKYSDGWFVGFFNLNGKNYSMVVFVPNIDVDIKGKVDEEGGNTAAPIFKEVVNSLK